MRNHKKCSDFSGVRGLVLASLIFILMGCATNYPYLESGSFYKSEDKGGVFSVGGTIIAIVFSESYQDAAIEAAESEFLLPGMDCSNSDFYCMILDGTKFEVPKKSTSSWVNDGLSCVSEDQGKALEVSCLNPEGFRYEFLYDRSLGLVEFERVVSGTPVRYKYAGGQHFMRPRLPAN